MSRRNRYRRSKPSLCHNWPWCSCGDKWEHWGNFDPYGPPLTEEQLEAAKASIVFMLLCVSQHCPVAHLRNHATLQLMRPIFADEAKHWIN